jgi:membrane dipeptidase
MKVKEPGARFGAAIAPLRRVRRRRNGILAADETDSMKRRDLLLAAGAAWLPGAVAQTAPPPIADMHSHYGLISRRLDDSGFAEELRSERVALVAWKLVADIKWLRVTPTGIEQRSEPAPGELAAHFEQTLRRMRAYLDAQRIVTVLTPADVDAALAGEPRVVLASEGADFLEGRIEALDAAVVRGLRHLQFVHYIRSPVGDFQTQAPTHGGLSAMGRELVAACNQRGVLVDLAHLTGAAVEQALEIAQRPLVWSHGFVDGDGGHWQDPYGYLKRRLSLALARKIAAAGGVVGLWGLGLSRPGPPWPVAAGDTRAYAREVVKLIDAIGPDHVAFGSDIEGVGPNWVLNRYSHLRSVVEHLQGMKLDAATLAKVASGNYARVLRQALQPTR